MGGPAKGLPKPLGRPQALGRFPLPAYAFRSRTMRKYVIGRVLLFIPSLLGASLVIFVLLRLVPGDIAEIIVYQAGAESASV